MASCSFDHTSDDAPDWDLTDEEVYEAIKDVDFTKSYSVEEVMEHLFGGTEEQEK